VVRWWTIRRGQPLESSNCPGTRIDFGRAGLQELQKMENSGNELKKWLKTKDMTFLSDANYARFACKFAQFGR
jgi:hypothetical protein